MMRITGSGAVDPAEDFSEVPRQEGESNVAWVRRQLEEAAGITAPVEGEAGRGAPTLLLLLGGRTSTAFRVRVAQSHLRDDLSPSQWSHAALLAPLPRGKASERQLARLKLFEVSLEPETGFGFAAKDNGLQDRATLGDYRAPERYPNIALLRVPVPVNGWLRGTDEEKSILERFQRQRAVLDVPELIVQWLSFVWGVGGTGNPLLQGHGLPSAAMIEVVLSAAGYDLTPGLESRASCPEAMWQAAKWWHSFYAEQGQETLRGTCHVGHRLADYDRDG